MEMHDETVYLYLSFSAQANAYKDLQPVNSVKSLLITLNKIPLSKDGRWPVFG